MAVGFTEVVSMAAAGTAAEAGTVAGGMEGVGAAAVGQVRLSLAG
jgi:hypothetical protein